MRNPRKLISGWWEWDVSFKTKINFRWKCPSCRKICCCAACRRREMRDKENGTSSATTTAPSHATSISEPRIASTTQQRPPPSMGIEYPANGHDSPPSLNPFASSASSTSSFKALYAIAQMPSVKKHIKYILSRKDITDAQRVESIATLLRGSSSKSSRPKQEDMKGEGYNHHMGGTKWVHVWAVWPRERVSQWRLKICRSPELGWINKGKIEKSSPIFIIWVALRCVLDLMI